MFAKTERKGDDLGVKERWLLLLVAAMVVLSIGWAFIRGRRYKKTRLLTARAILFGGTFFAVFVLCLGPALMSAEQDVWGQALLAVHDTIRIFVLEKSPQDFFETAAWISGPIAPVFVSALFLFASCLTFDLVLSLFGTSYGYLRLFFGAFKSRCVFSAFNEKSVALAESIYEQDRGRFITARRMLVFHDVQEADRSLLARARAIDAVLFKTHIATIDHRMSAGRLQFFIMGDDGEESIDIATHIKNRYGDRERTTLYVFSSSVISQLLACAGKEDKLEIRKIDEARSMIYRMLYDMERDRISDGTPDLFSCAVEEGAVRKISAVIVGPGRYGEELLKTLTWFCQMDGYKIRIDLFDVGDTVGPRLCASCPELMEKASADASDLGDSQYEIAIHPNTDPGSPMFAEKIKTLSDTTFVFVCLDEDEPSISTAIELRRLFAQQHRHPQIRAMVRCTDTAGLLMGCRAHDGQDYDIQCVGDVKTVYAEKVIINSELMQDALEIHLKYGRPACFDAMSASEQAQDLKRRTREFYTYEYFCRSSMASALHLKARIACGLQGDGVSEDVKKLSVLEHRRWNTYMRTEGYRFSGSLERSSRNDLAKLHNLLVPFDKLPEQEKEKDRRVSL